MATKFTLKDMLIVKEDGNGDIPANPTLLRICINGFDLAEEPQFDEKGCLLSSTKKRVETSVDFSGGLTVDLDADMSPVIATHIFGSPTTVSDATAEVWQTATAEAVSDIVNHSDGVHTLVCTKIVGAGLTGGIEPTIPAEKRGSKITDNEVTWVVMPKLIKYEFRFETTSPTFTIEYKLEDGSSNTFYKQYSGVDMSQLPIALTGDTSVPEISLDLKPKAAIDSEDDNWIMNLEGITGAQVAILGRDYLGGACSNLILEIDDVQAGDYDEANMTIDKQLTTENRINCTKTNKRDPIQSGSMTKDFTISDYADFAAKTTFKMEFIFKNAQGASALFLFPKTEPSGAEPLLESSDQVLISPELSATDDDNGYASYATIIAPSLVDSSGAIIGTGQY